MPVNRHNLGSENCWSCGKQIGNQNPDVDISLDGGNRNHVCEKCWEQIPISGRLALQLLARPQCREGLGIPDLVAAVEEVAEAIKNNPGGL